MNKRFRCDAKIMISFAVHNSQLIGNLSYKINLIQNSEAALDCLIQLLVMSCDLVYISSH